MLCLCCQVIKDYQLMALVFVLVLFDVLVLTLWEFVSPLEVVVYNTTAEHLVSRTSADFLLSCLIQSFYSLF